MLSIVRSIKCGQVTRDGPAHKRCRFQDWFRGTCADDDHDVCSETIKPPEETSKDDPLAERITVRNASASERPLPGTQPPRRRRSFSPPHHSAWEQLTNTLKPSVYHLPPRPPDNRSPVRSWIPRVNLPPRTRLCRTQPYACYLDPEHFGI